MSRVLELKTQFDAKDLLFQSMNGSEALGRPFEYDVLALSERNDLDSNKILGQKVAVSIERADGDMRWFDGYGTRFGLVGVSGRLYQYRIAVRPWLWMLSRTSDCRIFQKMTVPKILEEIFGKYEQIATTENKLAGDYSEWEYCVQYRETDLNFVQRLMEQEGIYYYFEHEDGKHTLVLCDATNCHAAGAGCEDLPFIPHTQGVRLEQEYIQDWQFSREIQPGNYALRDFDFKNPSLDLSVKSNVSREHPHAEHDYYDYPGEYVTSAEGKHYVQARIDELHSRYEIETGNANARALSCGNLFTLTGHARKELNREYLVVSTDVRCSFGGYEGAESPGAEYHCSFTALNTKQVFRPQRVTPKPLVQGPQTAIVVGTKGKEIDTDEYGRVKVQFHWDRYGKKDENSSCWVRVSHPWAGKGWGMVAIPRIGQEVIVDFLEGDPDQPIITGRTYNAEQMPPYTLPANMTQSGVRSRSSEGGSPANYNEIRFEDKKGAEQILVHAEKNQDNEVENDETTTVGHDRTEKVGNNETITIGVDRTEKVGSNETISIGANRTEKVGANEDITIGANRTEKVVANETINIGSNRSITVGATETAKVALQRTHLVGANETIGVGGAQEVGIGGFQAIVVGVYQTTKVGAYQNNDIGAAQTTTVGAAQTVKVGAAQTVNIGAAQTVDVKANATKSIGADESRSVTGGRSTSVGKDDSLKITKNLVIDAGESVTIKTGDASITMKKDGTITIKGKNITVQGSGKINVKADSDVVIKGSKVLQN